MCAGAPVHVELQCVSAYQAAWRVHQHVVRDGIAFGIKRLQDSQRALMLEARDAAAGFQAQFE